MKQYIVFQSVKTVDDIQD